MRFDGYSSVTLCFSQNLLTSGSKRECSAKLLVIRMWSKYDFGRDICHLLILWDLRKSSGILKVYKFYSKFVIPDYLELTCVLLASKHFLGDKLTLSFIILKNRQTCEHRKIFKVCLAIFEHYLWGGYILYSQVRLRCWHWIVGRGRCQHRSVGKLRVSR